MADATAAREAMTAREAVTGSGVDYRGVANITMSGERCMNWRQQSPHMHTRTEQRYPGKGLGDHNLCRNPDGEPYIWCYTTNPKKRWEHCLPVGANHPTYTYVETKVTDRNSALSYRGTQNKTRSGRTCQKWTAQSPHRHFNRYEQKPTSGLGHTYGSDDDDHNYCRSAGYKELWCYTTDPNKRWEACDDKLTEADKKSSR